MLWKAKAPISQESVTIVVTRRLSITERTLLTIEERIRKWSFPNHAIRKLLHERFHAGFASYQNVAL
jgi:hypothetical protein